MGMINIEMRGSFGTKDFVTSAANGGHVCAIKRSIKFLADQLGEAVVKDVLCTKNGVAPPNSPLGQD